jgi:YegS/Rv2252/BmrU family lipid kinase
MRLLVAFNPEASQVQDTLGDVAAWFDKNCDATLLTPRSQADLNQLLRRHGPDAERIVIGGGDGTISNALPVLLQLGKPLAVLPLGTANDFAKNLGLPQDGIACAHVALHGRVHKVDVGLVNGTPFLNVASVGLAAKVTRAQSKELKRTWRVLSYGIGLIRAAREARPFLFEIEVDGAGTWSGLAYQVSVGNGRYHGGGLTVAEHAAIDDAKLHLYIIVPGSPWQLLAGIIHLKFGFAKSNVVHRRTASQQITIRTSQPRSVSADGEIRTMTPARFTLLPRELQVVVPQN